MLRSTVNGMVTNLERKGVCLQTAPWLAPSLARGRLGGAGGEGQRAETAEKNLVMAETQLSKTWVQDRAALWRQNPRRRGWQQKLHAECS